MKAEIDRSGCIGCGLCVGTCPQVFGMADDAMAEILADVTIENWEDVKAAAENCPVAVISVEE